MSNYHVLKQTKERHEVIVVYHLSVPAGQNSASKDYTACVKEDLALTDSIVPGLETSNPTEHAQILNGEVVEVRKTVRFNANLTNGQKQTQIEQQWTNLNDVVDAEVQNQYQWWGFAADVP